MNNVSEPITKNKIHNTFSYGVIYVYSIPDEGHIGRLKIGEATVSSPNPTQEDIDRASHERIKQQTKTADINYHLEHAELAINKDGNYFPDHLVHDILIRSGYERKSENVDNILSEWFEVSLDTAINAIKAAKEGRKALSNLERINFVVPQFIFRPNQRDAIDKTTKAIRQNRKNFLWNAKMRFGKTSAAMQVAKENKMEKVLIVTHRPSVSIDWYEDFKKVFGGTEYEYSSRTLGEHICTLIKNKKPFIYFASLQDLRLSKRVVQDELARTQAHGFDKNDEVFDTAWDMMIVDEAHEGTQSNLGEATFTKIPRNFTLELSGTPFNILHKREENEIYTWDYVMEQEEKLTWDKRFPGRPNPYAELPALSMFTYDIDKFASHLGDLGENFSDALDGAFKFHEFFRVKTDDSGNDTSEFVHKEMVNKFLDLLVNDKLDTKFPYATEEYRNYNKHSLWLLPNRVKVIEAMEKLLKDHPVFGSGAFGITNISGNNTNDDEDRDAKEKVVNAIKNHDFSITLTGQRLTTGASIPEWTAVFMMSDTSSATTYLQTAFRCQTPANIDGKIKTQGYIFDFAPDRTLRLIAEAIELNHKPGKTNTPEQKEAMAKFLNFCPILSAKGGSMEPYDVKSMLSQLKKAIIERVCVNGFDDPKLYNDKLLQLDELEINKFNELGKIVGSSSTKKTNEIEVNNLGMDELLSTAEEAERKQKQKQELTPEQKEVLNKLKEAKDQRRKAIDNLRAVSIRMPMLVYGANISLKEDIDLKKFIEIVDEESWIEFMPAGLSKEKFNDFIKYYDEEVFRGVTKNIRAKAFDCDNLLPTERIEAIAEIFKTFKNPDKETVLTPWNVVNMHITKTFGGHDFSSGVNDKHGKPEWVSNGVDTSIWSQDDATVLEINSKSGLYPLLVAYNFYSRKLFKSKKSEDRVADKIWREVLKDNIYVLCKSPMAKSITLRTLAGYKGAKTNIVYIEDLVKKLQQKDNYKGYNFDKELREKFGVENKKMKFTAVVGNPPYQGKTTGDNTQMPPIYHYFLDEAYKLSEKVSLITPARFLFNAGATPAEWNKKMLSDSHIKVIYFEQKSFNIFPNTDIKGGVVITYRDAGQEFGSINIFTPYNELNSILSKVDVKPEESFSNIIFSAFSYQFSPKLHHDHPDVKDILSKGHENDISTSIFDNLKKIFLAEKPENNEDYIQFYGLLDNHRVYRWIERKYVKKHPNLEKYKVWVAKANGSGELGEVLSTPLVGKPMIGTTHSFISIGAFDSKEEAINTLKYIKTKFTRTLLGVLKITQDNPPAKWSRIPLQDFTNKSDIDWTKSISEIDRQLYKKYSLDNKEIDFIESHVKPME